MACFGIVLLAAAGCRKPEVTLDTVEPETPDLPVLTVTAPARGAFLQAPVAIEGTVEAGTGALESLIINGESVSWDGDGAFSTSISPPPGMLLIGSRLEDDIGERAVDGRAVQVGPVHPPGAVIEDALALQMGPRLLDDDQPDLDDLAAVAEVIMEDPSFKDALVGTTISGTLDVTLTGFDFASASVDIAPQQDLLWLDTYLYDLDSTFQTSIIGISVYGSMHADRAVLQMDVEITTDSSGVVAEAVWTNAVLEGFSWEADWVPSWAESLLADLVRDNVESGLEEQAQSLVGDLLSETLSAFAIETDFGEGNRVHLSLDVSRAAVRPEGLVLWMDGAVSAVVPGLTLPPGGGSLRTDGAPPSLPITTTQPLATVVDDDFVSQFLFAFWHAGLLGGTELSGIELAVMNGEPLPPPLGPVTKATIDVGLPPLISPPTGDLDFDLSIGELVLSIEREDGVVITTSISARAGASMDTGSGGMALRVDDRPSMMEVHAGMVEWPEALDSGDLSSLFRLATPNLLSRSSNLFPAFPGLALPVGELMDVDAIDGLVWELEDTELTVETTGWMVLTSQIAAQ